MQFVSQLEDSAAEVVQIIKDCKLLENGHTTEILRAVGELGDQMTTIIPWAYEKGLIMNRIGPLDEYHYYFSCGRYKASRIRAVGTAKSLGMFKDFMTPSGLFLIVEAIREVRDSAGRLYKLAQVKQLVTEDSTGREVAF